MGPPTAELLQGLLRVGLAVAAFANVAGLQLHRGPGQRQRAAAGLQVHLGKQLLASSARLVVDVFVPSWGERDRQRTGLSYIPRCLFFLFSMTWNQTPGRLMRLSWLPCTSGRSGDHHNPTGPSVCHSGRHVRNHGPASWQKWPPLMKLLLCCGKCNTHYPVSVSPRRR